MTETVTMWFDPACPYTWRTSRWLRDVTRRRGAQLTWRLLSLPVLNEHASNLPDEVRAELARSVPMLRILAAAERRAGQAAVDRLYTGFGTRLHDKGEEFGPELVHAALADAGLPDDLAAAADERSWDAVVRDSHEQAQRRVGTSTGSPVVSIGDGPAFFGPVVVPTPDDTHGDTLFEALRLLSAVPEFSELKRARAEL